MVAKVVAVVAEMTEMIERTEKMKNGSNIGVSKVGKVDGMFISIDAMVAHFNVETAQIFSKILLTIWVSML